MLKGLRTVGFFVGDLERAKAWYTELLGKPPYFDQPFYVGFDVGGYELGLMPEEGERRASVGGDLAYWGVDDARAAFGKLCERGATPLQEPLDVGGGLVVASVRDPFGNALGVIENREFAPPLVAASATDLSDRTIVREAVVQISAPEAFAAWASSEGLASWWLPHSRIDLRPGGHYELYFLDDQPPGLRGSDGCRVLSFVPNQMLSFTWNAPPSLPLTRPLHTWVVLTFVGVEDGTRVALTHLGWPTSGLADAASQWSDTLAYFERAWTSVFELFGEKFGRV